MNRALANVALLVLSSVAVCQTSNRTSDCSTLKSARRHKVSCLCGSVEICSGDICGSPSVYELDDDITVELRDKSGVTLDTKKAVIEISELLSSFHSAQKRHTATGTSIPHKVFS